MFELESRAAYLRLSRVVDRLDDRVVEGHRRVVRPHVVIRISASELGGLVTVEGDIVSICFGGFVFRAVGMQSHALELVQLARVLVLEVEFFFHHMLLQSLHLRSLVFSTLLSAGKLLDLAHQALFFEVNSLFKLCKQLIENCPLFSLGLVFLLPQVIQSFSENLVPCFSLVDVAVDLSQFALQSRGIEGRVFPTFSKKALFSG